jgi:Tfp pilus assembly protein PilF
MDANDSRRKALEYFRRAYDAQTQGRLDEALEYYKRSIRLHPTAEAHTFLGWTYSFKGRLDEAIEQCKEAIALDPDLGNPYNDIGAYLIEKGQLAAAIPWLRKATRVRRYDSRCLPYANLGRLWERMGLHFWAMQAYQKALRENPEYAAARHALKRLCAVFN